MNKGFLIKGVEFKMNFESCYPDGEYEYSGDELEKVKAQNVQAYDLYVKGRSYYHHTHSRSTRYAIELFSRAIQIDENYALAYAGLADSYSQLYMYYDRNEENLERALAASQNALELDPELAEAHSSRGIALAQSKQYKEAEKEFEISIQLNPRLFVGYYQYARACRMQEKHEQAAKLFVGEHDFKNFSKYEQKKNPMREVLSLEVKEVDDCFIFDVIGISFLRQMVRRIANAILKVGLSQISLDEIRNLLDKSTITNDKIGPAPLEPYGSLILYKIANNLEFTIDEYSQERMIRFINNKIREHSLKKKSHEVFLKKFI